MVRRNVKNITDSSIIEYLMLDSNSETTASTIATSVGLKSAKDITNRLNALHKKGIIRKLHRGKKVYWTIAEDVEFENDVNFQNTGVVESDLAMSSSDDLFCVDDDGIDENKIARDAGSIPETTIKPSNEFANFRQYVTKELGSLRTVVENLCGTGNLVFGAVNTLDLLKEIDGLRKEVRSND